jgi:hypothetical protein
MDGYCGRLALSTAGVANSWSGHDRHRGIDNAEARISIIGHFEKSIVDFAEADAPGNETRGRKFTALDKREKFLKGITRTSNGAGNRELAFDDRVERRWQKSLLFGAGQAELEMPASLLQ